MRRNETPRPMRWPATFSVLREADGSFRLVGGRDRTIAATASGDGYAVAGTGAGTGWFLREESGREGSGFVLRDAATAEAGEIARSSRLAGTEGAASILLADGRLFRIVPRATREGSRVELAGWEAPGAYLVARPARSGWRVEAGPAGRSLDAGAGLAVIFAAEVLAGA